jgi:hypothetical protein
MDNHNNIFIDLGKFEFGVRYQRPKLIMLGDLAVISLASMNIEVGNLTVERMLEKHFITVCNTTQKTCFQLNELGDSCELLHGSNYEITIENYILSIKTPWPHINLEMRQNTITNIN